MTSNPVDLAKDQAPDPELEYRALLRSLRRTRDFGLFFVQCSPAEGERIIQRVRNDLPQKQIEVLTLTGAIDNLYDVVDALPNKDQIEILFIQGLELSLYEYEQERLWNDTDERYGYSEKGIPKLLAHLNLSRERFREHFNGCFVFLLPIFAIKYLMRHAPDFFDWRSAMFELLSSSTHEEDIQIFKSFLDSTQTALDLARLEQYEPTLKTLDKLCIPEDLEELRQKIQTITSYHTLLYEALSLGRLGKYETALKRLDEVLAIDVDGTKLVKDLTSKPMFWEIRGLLLAELQRYGEAVSSYDKALEIKPDMHTAWSNRGLALAALGHQEEAIASYDKALEIKPDYHQACYNKACTYALWANVDEAINNLKWAIALNPEYREQAKKDPDFDSLRSNKRFQTLVESDKIKQLRETDS